MTLTTIDVRRARRPTRPRMLEFEPEVVASVQAIVERVRHEGDEALLALTREYDGVDLSHAGLLAREEEFARAREEVPAALREALDAMIARLSDLHRRQLPSEWWAESDGVRFGEAVRPLARAGCYVPGGRASYPSTVAMTAVPARVAGVGEVVLTTPPRPDGSLPPAVLYAAGRAGVSRVVKVGGAQAIAALAYGTESVPAVDKVVGPGNVYVTAAKREVAGDVGIDSLAGPTELVVVADATADPDLLAADLVAQAEHDPLAVATLVAVDESIVARTATALEAEVGAASRREIVEAALVQTRALLVRDEEQAAEVVDELAPEHLQVLLADPRAFLARVRNAGAIFLGPWTPVPFGDYGVGSNHVLPTMGTARFGAGLRAADFVAVRSVVECEPSAVRRLTAQVALVARSEGLDGHARAVEVRAERLGEAAGEVPSRASAHGEQGP